MKPDIDQIREALRGMLRVWKGTSTSTATRLCFKEPEWSHEMRLAMDEARSALAALDGMVVIPADEYELLQLYKAHSTADLKGMELVRGDRLEKVCKALVVWRMKVNPPDDPLTVEGWEAYLKGEEDE